MRLDSARADDDCRRLRGKPMSRRRILLLAALFAASPVLSQTRTPDVIFVPTPQEVVEDMLRLADVKKGDVLYDLGSGDGRIPVTAAKKYGIRAVGIDIDPDRITEARDNARKAGVSKQVEFRLGDIFTMDFRDATVVTLYLLPELNVKLRPRLLAELRPGARIVSHQFDMGDWRADKKLESNGRTVYFWTVPDPKKRR
ncbi:MAG: class I SAM-dependent methyltransferase [Betaproteobacteria bacterium]|nr:MAG: class I SAM-dependent methyltransferase [Betaproteobacteria bacterium]